MAKWVREFNCDLCGERNLLPKLVHICIFDRSCWSDHKQFGMPMRIRIGHRNIDIPFLTGARRSTELWENATPRKMRAAQCSVCSSEDVAGSIIIRPRAVDGAYTTKHILRCAEHLKV